MFEELFVVLGEVLEDDGMTEQFLAHLYERPDNIDAHRHSPGAAEEHGCHDGAVFGEGPRKMLTVPAALAFL